MSRRNVKTALKPRHLATTAGELRNLLAEMPDDAPIVPRWESGKLRAMKDWDPGVDLFGFENGEEEGRPMLVARVGLFFLDDEHDDALMEETSCAIRAKPPRTSTAYARSSVACARKSDSRAPISTSRNSTPLNPATRPLAWLVGPRLGDWED